MDAKRWHYDVQIKSVEWIRTGIMMMEIKGWIQKGGIMMCKLKGRMDKEGIMMCK